MIDLVRRQLYMDAATRPIERCPSEAHAAVRCPWRRFPCECSRVSTRGSFCAYGGAVLSHRADVDRLAVVRAELLVRAAVQQGEGVLKERDREQLRREEED